MFPDAFSSSGGHLRDLPSASKVADWAAHNKWPSLDALVDPQIAKNQSPLKGVNAHADALRETLAGLHRSEQFV